MAKANTKKVGKKLTRRELLEKQWKAELRASKREQKRILAACRTEGTIFSQVDDNSSIGLADWIDTGEPTLGNLLLSVRTMAEDLEEAIYGIEEAIGQYGEEARLEESTNPIVGRVEVGAE
jgi:hypothetical protein